MTALVEPPARADRRDRAPPCLRRGGEPARVARRDRARAGDHQPQRLCQQGDGGGGPHRVAGPGTAGQARLQVPPAIVTEPPGAALIPQPPQRGPGADPLPAEHRRGPGAAGDHHGGDVRAGGTHDRAWHALVAVGKDHDPIQRVGADHLLDLDREQVAVEHGGRLHQVLAQRDRPELGRDPARLGDAAADRLRQVAQREVARVQIARRVRDPDHGPAAITACAQASGPEGDPVGHRHLVVAPQPGITAQRGGTGQRAVAG
jgi:hypothetical protein